MDNQKLKRALECVSKFIRSLETSEEISAGENYNILFSQENEGFLALGGEDATQYRNCLKLLIDVVGTEIISPRALETLYQKAILYVMDIHNKRQENTYDQRVEIAIADFKKSLTAEPLDYLIYYPVFGLQKEGLPVKVGNVTFCVFADDYLNNFTDLIRNYDGNDKEKERRDYLIDEISNSEIVDKTVALIKTKALDAEAAKIIALKELALTLDIINFFSDLIPYQKGYLYLPGERNRENINVAIIVQGQTPSFVYGNEIVGPLFPLSFSELIKTSNERNLGFPRVGELLSGKRSDLQEKIISALQWAGRATAENRKEEAFLLYAISLESLVLSDNEREELNYRLRLRTAHLLGKNSEGKKDISKKIRDLYDIRSKIVHSGWYEVTDANLYLLRYIAKGCILQILNSEPFKTMKSIRDFTQWCDNEILK